MSPTRKILTSVLLLGFLICLLAESVNGQEGEEQGEGRRRRGEGRGRGEEEGRGGTGEGRGGEERGEGKLGRGEGREGEERGGGRGGGRGGEEQGEGRGGRGGGGEGEGRRRRGEGSQRRGEGSQGRGEGREGEERGEGRGRRGGEGRGRRRGGEGRNSKSGRFSEFFENRTDVPAFCHEIACPKFVLSNTTKDYELREYEESKWLAVNKSGTFFDRLHVIPDYLSGNNTENEKVQIGVPMLMEFMPGQYQPENKLFYLSKPNPPTRDDGRVYIVTIPKQSIYVRAFDGYPTLRVIEENRQKLSDALGSKYDTDSYYVSFYNSPFNRKVHHNEIWMLAKN